MSRSTTLLVRLCAAAFLADMALYLTMTGAPYKALALGAGPLILGLLPMARALPYSLSTIWAGGLTEGGERLRLARVSLIIGAAAVLALIAVSELWWLFLLLGVLGTSLAFFWPAMQATLADLAGRERVAGNLGWFNIAWSSGKSAGFLVGGFLLAGLGFTGLFLASAFAVFGVILLTATVRVRAGGPGERAAGAGRTEAWPGPQPAPPAHPPATPAALSARPGAPSLPPARANGFRRASWIANSVSFGVVAVLNLQYPEWLATIGHGERLFGAYLGLIFASQTVVFGLLTRFPGWHYRVAPLVGAQLPLVGVLAVLPWLRAPGLILATAPVVGMALGTAYFASIYYSVHDAARRGRNAGVHEALLGIGTIVLPVLGGWIAEASGRLEAPYLFAAAAGLVAVGIQGVLLARSGGTGRVARG